MCKVCAFTIQPHHVVDLGTGSEDLDEQEVLQQQKKNGLGEAIRGAKTQQLIAILKATERGVKSLVFSQVRCFFLSMFGFFFCFFYGY